MTSLYGKEVLTSDDHKLGEVVNVLVDMSTGHADFVIFPKLIMKLVRTHSGNIAGQIAGQAVGTIKNLIPGGEIVDIVVDQAGGVAGMKSATKVKGMISVIEESYYLVPTEFTKAISSDIVNLSIPYDECKKWCLNAAPSPEAYMSFFGQDRYSGPERKVLITLNMPNLENRVLQDASGIETVIADLAFDTHSGKETILKGLVINDPRPKGASEILRAIPVKDIIRKGERLTTSKTLDEFLVVDAHR